MSIKIKSLQPSTLDLKSLNQDYLYKDLSLDLENQVFLNRQLNKKESLKDIQALFDVESVKNSIKNALLTSPGDKILNPTYGIDLRQFIFEPVNDFFTEIIRETIQDKLPDMEPRITIENLQVIGVEDENTYYIDLQINVPSLDIYGLSIKSELNSTGYTVL